MPNAVFFINQIEVNTTCLKNKYVRYNKDAMKIK